MTFLYKWRAFFLGLIGSFAAATLFGWSGTASYLLGVLTIYLIWAWPKPRDAA